jgi:hypothetical protein
MAGELERGVGGPTAGETMGRAGTGGELLDCDGKTHTTSELDHETSG